jgi:hypothetical protein
MTKTILILIFQFLIFQYCFSQIFKSNEQYSGSIEEIQDSVLRKEVLAVQDFLNNSNSKNKEVKKIFSNTKDTLFFFGGSGMISFQLDNDVFRINRFVVWYKPEYDFPSYSFNDLLIETSENKSEFPCKVFVSKKRTAFLFHCIEATINDVPYKVIFISNVHNGFLGRVLIKSN